MVITFCICLRRKKRIYVVPSIHRSFPTDYALTIIPRYKNKTRDSFKFQGTHLRISNIDNDLSATS